MLHVRCHCDIIALGTYYDGMVFVKRFCDLIPGRENAKVGEKCYIWSGEWPLTHAPNQVTLDDKSSLYAPTPLGKSDDRFLDTKST